MKKITWLHEEKLKKQKQKVKIRKLSLHDLQSILTLQQFVIQSLTDKNILSPLSSGEFQYILNGKGIILGAFLHEKLIAFRALLVPLVNDDEHLGLDVGLPKEALKSVIYQEISVVHQEYRGNRLQQILAALIMQELYKQKTNFRYICCTVAPFNIPSLKDKFNQGLEIASLKKKYDGQLRYIFVKDLQGDKHIDKQVTKIIDMGNITAQQEALAQGWRGYDMFEDEARYKVKYRKILDCEKYCQSN